MTDAANLNQLRKLANKIVEDGADADEIYDCLQIVYRLGKSLGRLEATEEAIERTSANFDRIGKRMEELTRHE